MPKIKGPKRSDRVIVRVYPEEKTRIENLAKAELKPVSDFIRERSLAGFTPEEGLAELNRRVDEEVARKQAEMKLANRLAFEEDMSAKMRSWNFWKMLNEWRSANRGLDPRPALSNKAK